MKDLKFSNSVTLLIVMVLVLLVDACQPTVSPPTATPEPPAQIIPTATSKPPAQILFIGDSFTSWNLGVDSHMIGLAASANPPLTIETSSETVSGFQLEEHWRIHFALNLIQEGNWDVVVLQEDTSTSDYDEQAFYEYTRKFDEEIKKIDAQTILYMPWEWKGFGTPMTTEDIAQVYTNIGAELGVRVAPVGLAWIRSIQERPDLNLYDSDKIHPSIPGTYLTMYVLYATIYGRSPVGLSYQFADQIDKDSSEREWEQWHMTEDEVAFLQRIAWETVVDYQAHE